MDAGRRCPGEKCCRDVSTFCFSVTQCFKVINPTFVIIRYFKGKPLLDVTKVPRFLFRNDDTRYVRLSTVIPQEPLSMSTKHQVCWLRHCDGPNVRSCSFLFCRSRSS